MSDGSFYLRGRDWNYEIISAQGYDGQDWNGVEEVGEHIDETDRIFYSVEDGQGEHYYRWLAGPFADIGDLEGAIQDETEEYE